MKEILNSFRIRIDENGKEVKNTAPIRSVYHDIAQDVIKELTTEVIKLPTLSEFVEKMYKIMLVDVDGLFLFRSNTKSYIDFLQQPLSKEMFIGEDAIFIGWRESKKDVVINNSVWRLFFYEDGLELFNYESCESYLLKTIEQALNLGLTLYLNPEKI